jgi:hypothetical protein
MTSDKLLPFIGLQPEKLKKIAVEVKALFDSSKREAYANILSRFFPKKN